MPWDRPRAFGGVQRRGQGGSVLGEPRGSLPWCQLARGTWRCKVWGDTSALALPLPPFRADTQTPHCQPGWVGPGAPCRSLLAVGCARCPRRLRVVLRTVSALIFFLFMEKQKQEDAATMRSQCMQPAPLFSCLLPLHSPALSQQFSQQFRHLLLTLRSPAVSNTAFTISFPLLLRLPPLPWQYLPGLGRPGDVVAVSPGYARELPHSVQVRLPCAGQVPSWQSRQAREQVSCTVKLYSTVLYWTVTL